MIEKIPEVNRPSVILEDMELESRKLSTGCDKGSMFSHRIRDRIERWFEYSKSDIFVAFFDEPEHVPKAKKVEQGERAARGPPPFTEEEMRKIEISDTSLPDMARLFATSKIKQRFYSYCVGEIALISDFHDKEKTIYIDAGFIMKSHMDKLSKLGTVIINFNDRRYTTRSVLKVVLKAGGLEKEITFTDTIGVGESDVKIINYIDTFKHRSVFVSSIDSDMLALILAHMKDWIDPKTGMITARVYISMDGGTRKNKKKKAKKALKRKRDEFVEGLDLDGDSDIENLNNKTATVEDLASREEFDFKSSRKMIVDMVQLWREVCRHFNKLSKEMDNKNCCNVEVLVMLMILTGTDYVEGIKGLGPKRLFKWFEKDGYKIVYGADVLDGKKVLEKYGMDIFVKNKTKKGDTTARLTVGNIDSDLEMNKDLFILKKEDPLILTNKSEVVCNGTKRQNTRIALHRLYVFMQYVFENIGDKTKEETKILKDPPRPIIMKSMQEIRNAILKKAEKNKATKDLKNGTKAKDENSEDGEENGGGGGNGGGLEEINENKDSKLKPVLTIPDDEELISMYMRTHWNMDYWTNDNKDVLKFDCMDMDKNTGLSKHGWEYDNEGSVKRAKRVAFC